MPQIVRSTPLRCVACGKPIPPDLAGQLCPRCLLGMAHEPLTGIFDSAEIQTASATPGVPSTLVGPYRVLRVLGEGGMGMVYLAEHIVLERRQVALKVIKPGMDSRAIVARFQAERQAIALMEHPSIARVHDAGVAADGRLYFAMEYVTGLPITEYCDRERLPIALRLALFADVCSAVQHAHEKHIIHRDLKPSNVLVTRVDGRPLAKVIDFGVAKAINPGYGNRTTLTEFGALIGTPEYMSPEQMEPLTPDIDPRSDVYSLGVLLYELLTGTLPFDRTRLRDAGYHEIRQVIREEDPPRPSTRMSRLNAAAAEVAANRQATVPTLARALRGDLDWICLKALEKDRRRRYPSAANLVADIRRFLAHEPVTARPPTLGYRVGKYVQRHRVGVAVSVAIGAALSLGFAANALLPWRLTDRSVVPGDPTAAALEVVTSSGVAGLPALSPDARMVAFVQGRNFETQSLWLADVRTGNTEPLPVAPEPRFFYLQWSHSGKYLYFGTEPRPNTTRLQRYSFDDRRLDTMAELNMRWVAVSRDERRIAGVRNDQRLGVSVLVVANLDGSGARELAKRPIHTPYLHLSWSPDGDRIAASVGHLGLIGEPMLVVAIDMSGGGERLLSHEKWLRAGAKTWLPDGRRLLLVGQKWRQMQRSDSWLWVLDANTGESRRIQIGPDEFAGWSLSLSADGGTLAATRTHFAASLWIVPHGDTARAREIATAWMGPRFLPDGRLVFNGADKYLWRIRPDGSDRSRVGTGFYKAVARDVPAMVFATGDGSEVSQIWRADLNGQDAVQLTHAGAATNPDISPDGRWVVYVSVIDEALWKVPLGGGAPVKLAPGLVDHPAISPDGRWVAVSFRQSEGRPWIPALVPMDGGGIERTLPLPPGTALWHVRFSRDGTGVDLALTDRHAGNIWRLPLDGRSPVQLTHFTADELRAFDWSWDGTLLACLRGGWRGDIVLLRGAWQDGRPRPRSSALPDGETPPRGNTKGHTR